MYRVQIEVTTQQSERIHLERESYSKAEECRLFSGAKRVVGIGIIGRTRFQALEERWVRASNRVAVVGRVVF